MRGQTSFNLFSLKFGSPDKLVPAKKRYRRFWRQNDDIIRGAESTIWLPDGSRKGKKVVGRNTQREKKLYAVFIKRM